MESNTESKTLSQHRHPLELVASIAAALLSGELSKGSTPTQYFTAADEAVRLLDACKVRLEDEPFFENARHERISRVATRQAQVAARVASIDAIREKFPAGVSWLKGLFYITGKRSEADELPPFKE